jgi:hypothetical protein
MEQIAARTVPLALELFHDDRRHAARTERVREGRAGDRTAHDHDRRIAHAARDSS